MILADRPPRSVEEIQRETLVYVIETRKMLHDPAILLPERYLFRVFRELTPDLNHPAMVDLVNASARIVAVARRDRTNVPEVLMAAIDELRQPLEFLVDCAHQQASLRERYRPALPTD